MSGSLKKIPQAFNFYITPRDEYMPLQAWGNYKVRHDARFHPASSPYDIRVKPLIKSSSEAPFTCCE
jgi:hypothetical protein